MKKLLTLFIVGFMLVSPCWADTADGTKTVTTAGTAEALTATVTAVAWANVQALAGNAGIVYLGASTVSSARGIELLSGDSFMFPVIVGYQYDLAKIFIDVSVNGEGVDFTYEAQ